jgi:mRNA interferase MazF
MFRGEIWVMSLEKTPKSGKGEVRPVIILSSDSLGSLPLRIVVPLTSWKDAYFSAPWMVRIPPVLNSGLDIAHAADALQVRSISTIRLINRMGEIPKTLVDEIARAVALVINI